jgi:tetratricopeptide (TPR) repeat protein
MEGAIRDAWWQYVLGFNGEARKLARRVLDDAKRRGDAATAGVADTLLGMVARDELDFATAGGHFQRGIDTLTKALGEGDIETLHARAQRVNLWQEEKRDAEAVGEAAAIKALAPPLTRPVDRRLFNVHVVAALAVEDAGRPAEALRELEALVAMLDDDALLESRATATLHLACVCQRMGDHERACALMAECVALRAKALGEGAPRVAMARFTLAGDLLAAGRAAEALPVAQAAMAAMKRLGLEKAPRMSNSWAALGTAYLYAERMEEATVAMETAAAIEEKTFGAAHRSTARMIDMLATLHSARGNAAKAAALLGRALPALLDAGEPEVDRSVERYLGALTTTGRHRAASEWAARTLTQRKGKLTAATVASLEWAIAQGHLLDGNTEASKAPMERAIAAAKEAHGTDGEVVKEYEHHLKMVRSGAKPQRKSFA